MTVSSGGIPSALDIRAGGDNGAGTGRGMLMGSSSSSRTASGREMPFEPSPSPNHNAQPPGAVVTEPIGGCRSALRERDTTDFIL
ncbi:hypothetical protein GCM10009639_34520 [Kitasatospora putterlickiae]|uniref:Uncharacterized protein n=1 Tax=Kitasatospora putterlickiae TaxID=221725 RepID=A0ABN1Y444_9ACTN